MKKVGFVSVSKNHNQRISYLQPNLLTDGGRDQFHSQCYIETSPTATERGTGWIGVTTNTTGPSASDTSLTGELSSNGFTRADAVTKTHTNGTNSSTIEHTFTSSGTVTAIHKSALFDATTSGNMSHIANFSADVSVISGDTLKVTWTLNLG